MKISKKLIALLLSVVMIFGMIPAMSITASAADFSGYTAIYNESGLNAIRNNLNGKYYLANNITLTSKRTPIGDMTAPFTGIFDGNGYGITNLSLSASFGEGYALLGLFGVNKGTIRNFKIENCNLSNEITDIDRKAEIYYGAIAAANFGTIENSCVRNSSIKLSLVSSYGSSSKHAIYGDLGGVVGVNYNVMKNCFNYGGSVQIVANVNPSHCNTYARVGGVVSTNYKDSNFYGIMSGCYNTASVQSSGKAYCSAAGVVALNKCIVEDCFNNGSVKTVLASGSTLSNLAGGVSAYNASGATISKSRNRGTITGSYCVAGVSAANESGGKIDMCYNDGKISSVITSGQAKAGGIVAENQGTISNCFNAQSISAKSSNANAYAGGLVGVNFAGTIKYSYNTGALSAKAGTKKVACIGGIAGHLQGGSASYCYYPSNQKGAYGKTVGKGLSTSAMKKKSSYSGFDFTNTWMLDSEMDYACPILKLSCKDVHWGKWLYVTKATLTKNGTKKFVCSICGQTAETATTSKISSVKLSGTAYTYNGKVKTPTVTVKDSAGKTIPSKYYTVKYASGRKYVGKYKVTVTFKGLYSGTKTLYFKINPKAAGIASLTAKSKALSVKINRQTSQSTGYQIQYSTSKKFSSYKTKTVSYKTSSTTLTKLKARTTYYVRIRTYKIVSGTKYYSAWSSYKYKKTY